MTRDDIILMALEAELLLDIGTTFPYAEGTDIGPMLKRFAALVAAAEREACAKVCESEAAKLGQSREALAMGICAAAIRARGEEQPYATQAAMVESQTHGRMQIDPATGNVSIGAIRARGEV